MNRRHSAPVASGAAEGSTDADGGVSTVNAANALTLLRLLLVPGFVVVLFTDNGANPALRFGAVGIFAVAAVSDRLDGELARRRGLVTDFGKVADPIADKALTGAALVSLSVLGELGWWVTGIILARETGITLLRFLVIRHGVIPASRGGKLKTVLQVVAIGAYVLPVSVLPLAAVLTVAREWLMGAAVVVTVVTAADYLVQAVRLRRASSRTREVAS